MFLKLTTRDGKDAIFNMELVMEIIPLQKGCRLIYAFEFQGDYSTEDVDESLDEIWKAVE